MKNRKKSVLKLCLSAIFAALICVGTFVVQIPLPFGYLNLGDCFVLLAGWFLCPAYAFAAAGMGSALADLFLGFAAYAPVTFVIKGLAAVLSALIFNTLIKRYDKPLFAVLIPSAAAAEIFMVGGYYLYESFLYGFIPALASVPGNLAQGAFGSVAGTALFAAVSKTGILKHHSV